MARDSCVTFSSITGICISHMIAREQRRGRGGTLQEGCRPRKSCVMQRSSAPMPRVRMREGVLQVAEGPGSDEEARGLGWGGGGGYYLQACTMMQAAANLCSLKCSFEV